MGSSPRPGSPEAKHVGGLWETWGLALALLLTGYAPLDKSHNFWGLGFHICKIGQLNQMISKSFDSSTSSFSVSSGLSEARMPLEAVSPWTLTENQCRLPALGSTQGCLRPSPLPPTKPGLQLPSCGFISSPRTHLVLILN